MSRARFKEIIQELSDKEDAKISYSAGWITLAEES